MRGEQDTDRPPLLFADMVRYLESVERCQQRRSVASAPEDLVPWDQHQRSIEQRSQSRVD
jgi:hypothetical protein